MATFATTWFIWKHFSHPCNQSPHHGTDAHQCTREEQAHVHVPFQLWFFAAASILAMTECYASCSRAIFASRLDPRKVLCSASTSTLAYGGALIYLLKMQHIEDWLKCRMPSSSFGDKYGAPEANNCDMLCPLVVSGLIGLTSIAAVTMWAMMVLYRPKADGALKLGNMGVGYKDYDDDALPFVVEE